jgi:hypothetical protein
MKKSPETFQQICDAVVNEGASLSRAAAIAGLNPASLFRWLGSSAENPNDWLHEWGDFGIAPFHIHVKNANRICVALLQGEAVRMSLKGFERTQVFQGRVQYEERLDIPPDLDADTMELLYGVRDRYKRDEVGNMIPLKIAEAPNPQLMAAVLRALGGQQWADKRSVDVKVTQSPGVTRIGPMPPPQHQLSPPTASAYVDEPVDDALDAPRDVPPVNTEPPAPPQGEAAPPTALGVRAEWEALLAKSKVNTASKKPTGIVNTGLSLLSDT